ncbi:MAG: fucose isomerase, partial [Bryobacteraceae bacterium]|nr:fucose isomerase [Bryobacteraceae bacterium]
MADPVILIANGDLRLSANQKCWPAQQAMEAKIMEAVSALGHSIERGHPFIESKQHGFI